MAAAKLTGIGGAVFLGGAMLLRDCLYTVEGGHRSILFSRLGGLQEKVYKEGLFFVRFVCHFVVFLVVRHVVCLALVFILHV